MTEKKQDLRIKKTQLALATALFALLERTPFSKITVLDICTQAMVSRSTFYVHFEDKYQLLKICLSILKEQLFIEYGEQPYEMRLRHVLESVLDNKKMFQNLVGSEQDTELVKMMCDSFQQDIEQQVENSGKTLSALPGPPDVLTVYYAYGIASAVLYWVSKPEPDPIDDMVKCIMAVIAPIYAL